MRRLSEKLEDILYAGIIVCIISVIVMMAVSVLDRSATGEAPTGSFAVEDFNTAWKLTKNDSQVVITLPINIDAASGDKLVIENTLPEDLHDGMSLMIRAAMEDVRIYVGDDLRASYLVDDLKRVKFFNPSAYVVAQLDASDSGSVVRIEITVKVHGTINGVTIGDGNNVWFPILRSSISLSIIAILVIVFGVSLLICLVLLGSSYGTRAMRALSFLMIDVGLWVLSESRLRQLIYARPSLSFFYSFITLEIVGVLACMYFDEIQHRRHHRSYITVELLAFLQVVINVLLHFFGVRDMYDSLVISHFWLVICAGTALYNIISDIRDGSYRRYKITAIGVVLFVVFSMGEMVKFYFSAFSVLGSFVCLGLLALMIATIIQTIVDETAASKQREQDQKDMTYNTIETIANAIDARDEYTGGHSERVGYYAQVLARRMAADYGLSEEDIMRIHYIGLVHDIGKIGVADSVLNKSGRLTEEEFSLMKKHPGLGYEIMSLLGDGIEGLLDGIRYHHERYDGTGYPDGLAGESIPLVARILALADSYDAMTSNRVYRKRLTEKEVVAEIERCAGSQFDPALTRIFLELISDNELKPMTLSGVAVNESGGMRTSSLLETVLQNDLNDNKKILHPSHVRMMCYIIRLMEKKGKDYQIVFTKMTVEDPASLRKLNNVIGNNIGNHDMIVSYTAMRGIVALFDRTEEERNEFIERIKEVCPEAKIWPLYDIG